MIYPDTSGESFIVGNLSEYDIELLQKMIFQTKDIHVITIRYYNGPNDRAAVVINMTFNETDTYHKFLAWMHNVISQDLFIKEEI